MTLTFNTKFNIGDTIYCAECYDDYIIADRTQYTITAIDTHTSANGDLISYHVYKDGVTVRRSECWLHATYEECTKWCKAQNK